MAKVNMMQLREDPPNIVRMYWAVGVDGTEFYKQMTLATGEIVCPTCEGDGRDPVYDYRCMTCDGEGIVYSETTEAE